MRAEGKRAAFEPVAGLLAPVARDPQMRRPASTVAGGVLVLLRAAAGVLWIISAAVQGPAWLTDLGDDAAGLLLTPDGASAALTVGLSVLGVACAIEAVLGFLVLRGRNVPRVILMLFSVVSISSAFVGWMVGGQDIRINTTLLTLALDILVLLALSSRASAAYARRHEPPRGRDMPRDSTQERRVATPRQDERGSARGRLRG